jgi:hypothetical protein
MHGFTLLLLPAGMMCGVCMLISAAHSLLLCAMQLPTSLPYQPVLCVYVPGYAQHRRLHLTLPLLLHSALLLLLLLL